MSKEKRKDKRIELNLNVEVAHESRLQRLYSKNLSRGGIYLKSDIPIPLGSTVTLSFSIKELAREFKVKAKVVHTHTYETFEDESTLKKEYGMGLKFLDIDEEDQSIIERFIIGKELKKGD